MSNADPGLEVHWPVRRPLSPHTGDACADSQDWSPTPTHVTFLYKKKKKPEVVIVKSCCISQVIPNPNYSLSLFFAPISPDTNVLLHHHAS